MSKSITEEYDIPLPTDVLFHAIALRYGQKACDELVAVYRKASRRYSHAATLNAIKRRIRSIKNYGSFGMPAYDVLNTPKFRRYQYCIDHSLEFINGEFSLTTLREDGYGEEL